MDQGFTDEQRKIVERVAKLMQLAAHNPNEDEAAAAHAKAQEMLIAYNLDMSAINDINNSGQRQQEELEGGKHEWQQNIWEAVADLNFCTYWNTQVWVESKLFRTFEMRVRDGKTVKVYGSMRNRHNLIGRVVNIAGTRTMAQYLEEVCTRIVTDACRSSDEKPTGRWATNFCNGMSLRLIGKIYDRRHEVLSEEQRKRHEEMAKAGAAMAGEASTSTALTLAAYSEAEEAANYDFKNGVGAYAKLLEHRAQWAREEAEEEERHTRWALANPEKAREQERKQKERDRRRSNSDGQYWRRQMNKPGYAAGYAAGADISIDQQTDHRKPKALLT